MNIIIPMAGMGKRMRPHTLTTPKPLIAIAGKPIVQRLVEDIVHTTTEQVEHIAFIIAPTFGKKIEEMLLDVAESLGAKGHIRYQEEALGTAHAILCAADLLRGNVFIAFADTLFKAEFQIDTQKDAIIWTQKVEDPSAFGVVVLDESGKISRFEEKPTTFVSDQAIIGVYYFRDGENLRAELQYLLDNDIRQKGEFQITDAMENMKQKGLNFYTDEVTEWLDCGNKDATVYTNQRILVMKDGQEKLIDDTAVLSNTTIIPPVYIGPGATVSNSVIGPYVSVEAGAKLNQCVVENSIIGKSANLEATILSNSLLGNEVQLTGSKRALSLGDFSTEN